MRQLTPSELSKVQTLTSRDVKLGLIEPTATGLSKSILDATQPVRKFLKDESIHDYDSQGQGPEAKVLIDTVIISSGATKHSKASLYRPQTKSGDPRIWFYDLVAICKPNDIIAFTVYDGKIWLFNLTRLDIGSLLLSSGPFKELVEAYEQEEAQISHELLGKLRVIATKGYIPATVDADTAIGRLLETELGISINSSTAPDYKGIGIKSYRSDRNNRKNLFAQVPDWNLSKYKSSKAMLDAFGYDRDGVKKLYCTVSSQNYNSQGLRLRVNDSQGIVAEYSTANSEENALVWLLDKLSERLEGKHKETFWVEAESVRDKGTEFFKFNKVEHTKSPIISQLPVLITSGHITLDHLIKEKGASVVEKGPIFKLKHDALDLLFPPSEIYELTS
jgi:hypothetical protein